MHNGKTIFAEDLGYFSAFPSYDSENVTSYELGHKGSYMDNTLQINASTYRYIYENIHEALNAGPSRSAAAP